MSLTFLLGVTGLKTYAVGIHLQYNRFISKVSLRRFRNLSKLIRKFLNRPVKKHEQQYTMYNLLQDWDF